MAIELDQQWHDLARRFDDGTTEVLDSPPMEYSDAAAMRFAFYKWRTPVLQQEVGGVPIYANLGKLEVTLAPTPDNRHWLVRFRLPWVSPTAVALRDMLSRPPEDDTQ